ncbi:hypothetical protein SCHPADRAFT_944015 [Schizopora paradoxa]|uniref:Uncharacterized protein n=1 Tax=Schizopora paradoxa TaxID=27342 RepID=A0A0H2RVX7_9AGAM|nr:hypothetical protein SCHPADRAFT_944015 [Schizopora paradoxa]
MGVPVRLSTDTPISPLSNTLRLSKAIGSIGEIGSLSSQTSPPYVWESSPMKRGTYQILSLCASTTVICIWSAVHRNIPPKRLTGLRSYAMQVAWVFVAFFLPEFMFVYALRQFIDARRLVKKFSRSRTPPKTPRKKGWFAFPREDEGNLGDSELTGNLEAQDSHEQGTSSRNEILRPQSQPFTLVHAFYSLMGGYAFDVTAFDVIRPLENIDDDEADVDVNTALLRNGYYIDQKQTRTRAIISPNGVRFLMEHEPDLTADFSPSSITARSKSNGLSKAFLALQVTWFCVSCVSRLASHLPLTLLEVITAAHGLCTLATYAAWWHKPLNVEEPTFLMGERAREAFAFLRMASSGTGLISSLIEAPWTAPLLDGNSESHSELALALRAAARYGLSEAELKSLQNSDLTKDIETESDSVDTVINLSVKFVSVVMDFDDGGNNLFTVFIVIMPAVYGSVHLLGWNIQFPTLVERSLWRVVTVAICSSGVLLSIIGLCCNALSNVKLRARRLNNLCTSISDFLFVWLFIIPFLYLFSTSYLLVESIRQLFYLPPEAFVIASLSSYFPHFS